MTSKQRAALVVFVGVIGGILALTLQLTPQATPAFDVAVRFTIAASKGHDDDAHALLSDTLRAYVTQHCPSGRVSACVQSYVPEDWGAFLNAVFRRARPDGPAWHVLVIATYAEAQGFSGVCVYTHISKNAAGGWLVDAWSGWISCDEPAAGLDALAQESAANRAP